MAAPAIAEAVEACVFGTRVAIVAVDVLCAAMRPRHQCRHAAPTRSHTVASRVAQPHAGSATFSRCSLAVDANVAVLVWHAEAAGRAAQARRRRAQEARVGLATLTRWSGRCARGVRAGGWTWRARQSDGVEHDGRENGELGHSVGWKNDCAPPSRSRAGRRGEWVDVAGEVAPRTRRMARRGAVESVTGYGALGQRRSPPEVPPGVGSGSGLVETGESSS